jgi:peptidyl-prolyl cis-trans isomerase A (cyclophilin A)
MKNWLFLGALAVILASLAFVVRFGIINFDRTEDREREQAIAKEFPGSYKSISGLHFLLRKAGSGDKPYPGSIVSMRYTMRVMGSEEVIEKSEGIDGVVKARVGQPPMMKGLTEGILGMRVGDHRTIIIPPQLAFGAIGKPPLIPQRATLIYEIELLSVQQSES